MTHREFALLAEEYGFEKTYFTKLMSLKRDDNDPFRLVWNAKAEFPFAKSIAVLVFPYPAFDVNERIPAYYLASNKAYFSVKKLIEELANRGVRAEKANISVKKQLILSGIGNQCLSSLVSIKGYGTRCVILALAIDTLDPLEYDERDVPCGSCTKCADACPTGAITSEGMDYRRCLRFALEELPHGDEAKMLQKTYIGCEICQYACPRNARANGHEVGSEIREAFDTARLVSGDCASARKLVGKNMTGGGKLTAEAISMAARDEADFFTRFKDELAKAEGSEFEAVVDAIRFAKELIGKEHEE